MRSRRAVLTGLAALAFAGMSAGETAEEGATASVAGTANTDASEEAPGPTTDAPADDASEGREDRSNATVDDDPGLDPPDE